MSHVGDFELEHLPGVEPHLISKLRIARIESVLHLAASIPHELANGDYDELWFFPNQLQLS
jgi:hypothetical protein